LSPAERAAVKAHSPAVASPRAVHQQTSPTYGGRNTPTRIAQDAADLGAAAARDRAAFDEAMGNR
jgi:filamentous hemagglutinin